MRYLANAGPHLGAPMHATLKLLTAWVVLGLVPAANALAQDAAAAAPKPGNFRGYSGTHWPSDFDVRSGHCDRARITSSPRRSDAIASLGERRSLNRTAAMLVGARVGD